MNSFFKILIGVFLFLLAACRSVEDRAAAETCACMQNLSKMHVKLEKEKDPAALRALHKEVQVLKEEASECIEEFENKYKKELQDQNFLKNVRAIADEQCPR